MQLTKNMNFIQLGEFIMGCQKVGDTREAIEDRLQKAFKWSPRQITACTDPYYEDKQFKSKETKVRRR